MARRLLGPYRAFRAERMGFVVGILALVAFTFYMTD
jgi:hypothetical protein